jgi:glycosyltransferase involved in cell wall biosynthesis
MDKVLILSYYFPPYTGIEGNRVFSWFQYFGGAGLYPIVVTRQWEAGGQKSWEDYIRDYGTGIQSEKSNVGEIYRVPHRHRKNYIRSNRKFGGLWYWWSKVLGDFHIETDAHHSIRDQASLLLAQHQISAIIVSSPPLNLVRLGYELHQQFNIPLVVDFRDHYCNKLLFKNTKFTMKEKVENAMFRHYVQRWLGSASLVTSVSQPILDMLPLNLSANTNVVHNGFEADVFSVIKPLETKRFTITILGQLYITQDIDFMLQGFQRFQQQHNDVLIQFIGLAHQTKVVQKITAALPDHNYLITPRLLRKEAIAYLNTTNVLYYIGWKGAKGIYSGKIFEYIATKLPVLIAPGDEDVIDELLKETGAGISASTPSEMVQALTEWYKIWEMNGTVIHSRNSNAVNKYSRQEQSNRFAAEIKKVISKTLDVRPSII